MESHHPHHHHTTTILSNYAFPPLRGFFSPVLLWGMEALAAQHQKQEGEGEQAEHEEEEEEEEEGRRSVWACPWRRLRLTAQDPNHHWPAGEGHSATLVGSVCFVYGGASEWCLWRVVAAAWWRRRVAAAACGGGGVWW